MTDDATELEATLAAATSANSVVSLLLGLWDEAVARGAGPEVLEQLAEHLVAAIPDLEDHPR